MIVERQFPTTLSGLINLVRKLVGDADSVALQAGHFLVYYDRTEDQLLPCIASELSGPRQELIRDSVGYFPLLTWEVGLALLEALPSHEKNILVLVNDWQYLPREVDRSRFYDQYQHLPRSYRDALVASPAKAQLLTPPRIHNALRTGDFFSEQTLRNQYAKHVRQMIAGKALPPNTEISPKGRTLRCSLVNAVGRRQEIYCATKRQNCTHEVAELLSLARELSGCDVFINIFPLVCRQYVEAGTELAFDLFRTPLRMVLNLGMIATSVRSTHDLFASCEAILHVPN